MSIIEFKLIGLDEEKLLKLYVIVIPKAIRLLVNSNIIW